MWLDEFELKGYRSFSNQKGIHLKEFKKINLLLGANNIGKSNIVRFLNLIRPARFLTGYLTPDDLWDEKINTLDFQLKFISPTDPTVNKTVKVLKNSDIIPVISGDANIDSFSQYMSYLKVISSVRGFVKVNKNSHRLAPEIDGIRFADYIFEKGKFEFDWFNHYKQKMKKHLSELLNEEVEFTLRAFHMDGSDAYLESRNLSQEYLYEQYQKKQRQFYDSPLEMAEFEIKLFRNKEWKIFRLEDLGMGVLQFVLILSALYESMYQVHNTFFEEIESNMHIRALNQLMYILETDEDFSNHRYFFLTHSSAIIDRFSDNYSVHMLVREEGNSTSAKLCTQTEHLHELLDIIGVKASQLLQSNVVIWVEGPSDKLYVQKWIELKAKQDGKVYIEGKDYSFVYYGGSLLHHYDLAIAEGNIDRETDTLIDIMATSRYSVIICDSDVGGVRAEIKARVKNIKNRLNKKPELEPYVCHWITAGREIENYVPRTLMEDVIVNDISPRKHFTYRKKRHTLSAPNPSLIQNESFIEDDSFDQFFAGLYIQKKGLLYTSFNEALRKNIAEFLSGKKIEIARNVANKWTDDCFGILDLDEKMKELLELIDRAQK